MPGIKKTLFLFTLSLISPITISASQVGFNLSVGGGPSFGELSDISSFGGVGSVGLSFKPDPTNSPEITLLGQFKYIYFPSDIEQQGDYQYLLAGLEFKLNLHYQSNQSYYVFIEGGLARTEVKENEFIPSPGALKVIQPAYTEDNPFVSPGFGFNFTSSEKMTFFAEVRVINVFGQNLKNHTIIPLLIGLQF